MGKLYTPEVSDSLLLLDLTPELYEDLWLWLRNRGYRGSGSVITLDIHRCNSLPGCEFEEQLFGTRIRCVHFWERGQSTKWFSKEDTEKFNRNFLNKLDQNPDIIQDFEEETIRRSDALVEASTKLLYETDLTQLGREELAENFREVADRYRKLGVYSSIPLFGGRILEKILGEYLTDLLKGNGKLKEFGRIFKNMTSFDYVSPLREEQEELYEIAEHIRISDSWREFLSRDYEAVMSEIENYPELDEILEHHTEKHESVPYKWIGPKWSKGDIVERLQIILKEGRTLPSYKTPEEIEQAKAETIREFGIDKKHELYFRALTGLVKMKEIKAAAMSKAAYHLEKFRREVMRRYGLDLRQTEMMIFDDYLMLLEDNIDLEKFKGELDERKNAFLWSTMGDEKFLSGEKALKAIGPIMERMKEQLKGQEVLYGIPAYPGKGAGRIKLVLNYEEDSGKFEPGDVLGAYRTTPHYEPLIMEASAIAVQEEGLTQHAANISRDEEKPCLVGVRGLEFAFKDGEPVLVDADNGLVRRLSEAELKRVLSQQKPEKLKTRRLRKGNIYVPEGPDIVWLDEVTRYDFEKARQLLGNKGRNQGILHPDYFVPWGFIVTTSFFYKLTHESGFHRELEELHEKLSKGINVKEAEKLSGEYTEKFMEIPPDIFDELLPAYRELGASVVVARSSSNKEDPEKGKEVAISFAGSFESMPFLKDEGEFKEGVRGVMKSLYSPKILFKSSRYGIDPRGHYMAVPVEEMLVGVKSGAIHTNCNNGEYILVEGCFGWLGPQMQMELTPDTYIIDSKTFEVIDFIPMPKKQKKMIVIEDNQLKEIELTGRKRVFHDKELYEISHIALSIQRLFGDRYQDVEFTITGPNICIYQNRDQLKPVYWQT
jgi:phosphoenolpyruvate synthase/pyruvate phosphate dikinase